MVQEGFLKFLVRDEILFWSKIGKSGIYPERNQVFYRGHFPIGVHILESGSICIQYINGRKLEQIDIEEPVMLGMNHVLDVSEYKYSVETDAKSKFIFLPCNIFVKTISKKNISSKRF